MKIGIDIDGVMTDMERFIVEYGIKYCYENNINYEINLKEYDEMKMLGISEQEAEKFWNEYLPYYAMECKTREFAVEAIKKLKEENEIYIITARNEEGLPQEYYGKMQEMVKDWLQKNNIMYDKLIFSKGSKLPYCLENGVEIMIEDSPRNIKDISSKIHVLCFNNSYNQDIENENVTRVYSWHDVLNKIYSSSKK